jgi:hypothetical protein
MPPELWHHSYFRTTILCTIATLPSQNRMFKIRANTIDPAVYGGGRIDLISTSAPGAYELLHPRRVIQFGHQTYANQQRYVHG